MAEVSTRLRGLVAQQDKARRADSAFVLVGTLLVWPAYFGLLVTDDYKDEIAQLKGAQLALIDASGKRCSK
jgi:hypothetical protein